MNRFTVDKEMAIKYGNNAAAVFEYIGYWVHRNRERNMHYIDGRYWTYNSISNMQKYFICISEKQIRTAISKLKEGGLIVVDVHNKCPWDRTRWYSLTESGEDMFLKLSGRAATKEGYNAGANENCDDGELSKESEEGEKESDKFNMGLGQMEETECQYGSLPQVNLRSGKKSDQYQKENKYKYTSEYTHTNKAQPKASQVSEITGEDSQYLYNKKKTSIADINEAYPEEFEELWKVYPKKTNKRESYMAWRELNPAKDLQDLMIIKVIGFSQSKAWTMENYRYVPNLAKWIRAEGWNDELPEIVAACDTSVNGSNCGYYKKSEPHRGYIKHNYTESDLAHIGMNFDDDDE